MIASSGLTSNYIADKLEQTRQSFVNPLPDDNVTAINRLTDATQFALVYRGLVEGFTGQQDVDVPQQVGVQVSDSVLDSKPMKHIEFRYPMPLGFPADDMALHFWGDAPQDDARFEVVLRVQISQEDLVAGHPQNFTLSELPYLERLPVN